MNIASEMPESFRAQLDAALARPMLLDPRALETIRAGGGFADYDEEDEKEDPPYSIVDGVAVISIEGPLARKAWQCWMFRGDGYDAIEQRILKALADKKVSAVVLSIDSPGGEVAGCFETVRAIRTAAKASGKPIVAYANELAASAAYALSCACSAIVLPDTGMVGSIGVITSMRSYSRQLTEDGVDVAVIASGKEKADGHPSAPLDPAAVARVQEQINALAQLFAAEVSQARGLSVSEVLGLQAGVRLGSAAVTARLADKVGNLGDALALARSMAATAKTTSSRAAAQRTGEKKMESVIAALGLKSGATEAEVFASVNSLLAERSDRLELLRAVGATDARTALGAIDGLKDSAKNLKTTEAERDALKERVEGHEAQAAIAKAYGEGAINPAHKKKLEGKSLAEVQGFLSMMTPGSYRNGPDQEVREAAPAKGAAVGLTTPDGKTWKELTFSQQAALKKSDPELYARMREANAR